MKYLERASKDVVCFCNCEDGKAIAAPPGLYQAACPWCGCGWLFSCTHCRKAFTFARVVERDQSYTAFVAEDRERFGWGSEVEKDRLLVESIAADLARIMDPLKPGQEYVYLDGLVLPAQDSIKDLRGLVGLHVFIMGTPQGLARDAGNTTALASIRSPAYWSAAMDRAEAKERLEGGVL